MMLMFKVCLKYAADVVILISYLCHDLQIDIESVVREKILINGEKYPVEKSKGVSTKYDCLK